MIVVTGASGLVGGNLVRALLAQRQRVRALVHHDRRALAGLELETISADLTDPNSLQQAFQGAEVVYHLASSISIRMDDWDELERINVSGTRNVVQACQRCGVRRLVHFSSIHAYRHDPFDRSLDETRPLLTGSHAPPYERSKVAAELEVRRAPELGLESVIIVPTAIVGPNDFRPSYFGQALQLLACGRIPALVRGGYDWVDVRDVVAGAIQAERMARSGSRYILSGHWHTLQEVARVTAENTGQPAPRLVVPFWLALVAQPLLSRLARLNGSQPLYTQAMLNALRSNQQISHARATADLGYAPRPFPQTLADTLAWFSDQQGGHA
ncbi:MAG: NAD-dependent epimerase/dehydratase family protein [Chloroflexota bacterium]